METTTTAASSQPKRIIYPGESLGGLMKFLGWFIFFISLIAGIAIGANDKSNSSAVTAIIIIAASIPIGLIFGALGCILENAVQLRKFNEGK
jgi:hypothetical protein